MGPGGTGFWSAADDWRGLGQTLTEGPRAHEPPGVEASLKLWAGGAASAAFQVALTCPLRAPLPTCRGSVQCT